MESVLERAMNSWKARNFQDEYVGTEWDVFGILWVATADREDQVPASLKRHLLTIRTRPYTVEEKVRIASFEADHHTYIGRLGTNEIAIDGVKRADEARWGPPDGPEITWEGNLVPGDGPGRLRQMEPKEWYEDRSKSTERRAWR